MMRLHIQELVKHAYEVNVAKIQITSKGRVRRGEAFKSPWVTGNVYEQEE